MKKAITILLTVLLSLSACGGETASMSGSIVSELGETITAGTAQESGVCGENLTWYYQDNVLVIRGSGAMTDYLVPSGEESPPAILPPWYEFRNEISTVVMEDGCTTVGGYAFSSCASLTSVDLPGSLETIDDHAFENCAALRDIALPDGLVLIGNWAFANCKLDALTLPDTLRDIGQGALAGCTGLTELTIPASVDGMGSKVFSGCENIRVVTFAGDAPVGVIHALGSLADDTTVQFKGAGFEESIEENPALDWIRLT